MIGFAQGKLELPEEGEALLSGLLSALNEATRTVLARSLRGGIDRRSWILLRRFQQIKCPARRRGGRGGWRGQPSRRDGSGEGRVLMRFPCDPPKRSCR